MVKVKLFGYVDSHYDDYENNYVLTHGISDWEEVSQEEFFFMRDNLNILQRQYHDQRLILVTQPEIGILDGIVSIKNAIKKAKELDEQRKAEAAKKKQAEADKKLAKERNKELAQLKKLQEKYGNTEK